MHLISVVIC